MSLTTVFEEQMKMSQQFSYRQCAFTVMDNIADPDIHFDENGICNYVNEFQKEFGKEIYRAPECTRILIERINEIKADGKGKQYDCIMGVSGGLDSTYVALLAKQYGLRPLLVHFDNGWDSETAVKNIDNIITKLGFDLYTYVVNWEEFRDIQRSFLKASVVDIEVITDHAILATLYKLCDKFKIRHIVSGANFVSEGILAPSWAHQITDWLNIKKIHEKYGEKKLKTYPYLSFKRILYNQLIKKINIFYILDYINYNPVDVKKIIKADLEWKEYGGKHHESLFTKFYQAYILPEKFGIDKRKAHYSSLICAGQLSKQQALELLEKPLYDPQELKLDSAYVLKKLDFSESEFSNIMHQEPIPHAYYPTANKKYWQPYFQLLNTLKPLRSFIRS